MSEFIVVMVNQHDEVEYYSVKSWNAQHAKDLAVEVMRHHPDTWTVTGVFVKTEV